VAVTQAAAGSDGAAAQLITLPGWRQFVAEVPSIPDLLAEQDWLSLEDGKRTVHDEERLEHHSRLVVVQTPVIGRIVKRGGDLIRMNRFAHYGRSGLIVSGPARAGKTTAVTQLGKTAEVMHRRRQPGSRDDIPVIYITVPPAATGKMIAMELARFLGIPVPRRANITDVIESVCGICPDTRVTMIIVDELHNLDTTTRPRAEASDTLKYFSNERLPATFVYAGIGLDRGTLLAGPRGDQVAGRFALIPATAFTRGMIGSLLWLIRDAACQAILDGSEKITRKSLDQIAVDMTAQAPPPRTRTPKPCRTRCPGTAPSRSWPPMPPGSQSERSPRPAGTASPRSACRASLRPGPTTSLRSSPTAGCGWPTTRTCALPPCSPSFPAWASATPGQRSTALWSATASGRTRVPPATRRA
jgi:Bacterial TniB protein